MEKKEKAAVDSNNVSTKKIDSKKEEKAVADSNPVSNETSFTSSSKEFKLPNGKSIYLEEATNSEMEELDY